MRAVSRHDGDDVTVNVGDWAGAREALLAGRDVDYQGASGPIDFTAKGDPSRGMYDVWTVVADGGNFAFEFHEGGSFTIPDEP